MRKKKFFRLSGSIKAEILFEDEHVVAVNKPAGILTVPIEGMKSFNLKECLDRYLEPQRRTAKTVHRIDRYTSGVVLFAKNRLSRAHLIDQFRSHEPARIYLALVRGVPDMPEGELTHHMKRIKDGFRNVIVSPEDPSASIARLHYRMIEVYGEISLLEIALETGLKNQIRVQLAAIGHPAVGDRHYARDEHQESLIDRQALHASRLEFYHPADGRIIGITAPLPHDMKKLIALYKKDSKVTSTVK